MTVTTNLLGPLRMSAAFTESLARKDEAAIINVSSGLAFVPYPVTPTHCATKASDPLTVRINADPTHGSPLRKAV
jgi:uncharacterized oxidoreductase